ncbi:type II secretion system protein GspM [Thioalkalivibrio sp. ALE19]|uniref:type II secretion system protein GspM n=1 Tax=Thioalkalivibrio sp. ALE19 TaxID=1266909 RepID=UPI00048E7F4A|nr:type II secretion system protein GspM [Thioalkalivibrio sp. ALE19]
MKAWERLDDRQKAVVTVGGGIALAVLFAIGVVEPTLEKRAELQDRVVQTQAEADWVERQADVIQKATANEDGEGLESNPPASPAEVLTRVETTVADVGIEDGFREARPSNGAVEVRFEGVEYAALVNWLERFDGGVAMAGERMRLQRGEAAGHVDATVEFREPET